MLTPNLVSLATAQIRIARQKRDKATLQALCALMASSLYGTIYAVGEDDNFPSFYVANGEDAFIRQAIGASAGFGWCGDHYADAIYGETEEFWRETLNGAEDMALRLLS